MTDKQTPPDWVLIEAMAQAMAQTEYPAMSYEELATVALNALRDTLEPVGWMYELADAEALIWSRDRIDTGGDGTETPLYALPEIKP